MQISQKAQYGLRAMFELARRVGDNWVKISEVAEAQAIPPRFLEAILGQLRQAEFVISKRGSEGGYMLARSPEDITVGQVLRFVEGPIGPVDCVNENADRSCPLYGSCAFLSLWTRVQDAMSAVYDNTSLQDLVEEQENAIGNHVTNYAI